MDREGLALIRRRLRPEERLLWWGKPRGGINMHIGFQIATVAVLIVNVVAWTAVIVTNPQEEGPLSGLLGIGFIALVVTAVVWLWHLIGPFQRARRCYAITDRGVIIVHGFGGRQTTRLEFARLEDIYCHANADGTGSITVYSRLPLLATPTPKSEARRRTLFRGINDIRHVCALLSLAKQEYSG
jgi:Bacterial PH domain